MDEDERYRAAWSRQPGVEQEWIRQNNVMYGGLIGIGIVMVQPFLSVSSLDFPAWICVVAFSVAIPLLAGGEDDSAPARACDRIRVKRDG